MPVAIMLVFFAIGVLGLPSAGTKIAFWYTLGLVSVDYFRVIRQSFGVLQLFKRRAEASFPAFLSRVDNYYFMSLFVLQLTTFVNGIDNNFDGRFDPANPFSQVMVVVAVILFASVVNGLVKAWRSPNSDKEALLEVFACLLLQSASALLVVYRTRLYTASLAMHFVEYHVLMAPRCLKSELDLSKRVDRIAAGLRRHKVVFYAGVVVVAAAVSGGTLLNVVGVAVTNDLSFGWLFVNLFNGIFVAHFFADAFLWKFHEPYYRKTLSPMFFSARGKAAKRRESRSRSRRSTVDNR
jgi:hypothetical protein